MRHPLIIAGLTVCAECITPPLEAQQFQAAPPVWMFHNADFPDVAVVDVDGDGRLDLVPDDMEGRIFGHGGYLRQTALGGFEPVDLPFRMGQYGGFVADLDGDGDVDIFPVYAINSSLPTGMAVNDGTGTFTIRPLPVAPGAHPLAIDVDRDGDLDCVRPDFHAGANGDIHVQLNAGNGVFGPPTVLIPAHRSIRLHAADVDGDGITDLVPLQSQNPDVLLGDGQGGFPRRMSLPQNGPILVRVAVADFDQDGDADIAGTWFDPVSNTWRDSIALLLQQGGRFVDASSRLQFLRVNTGSAVEAFDADEDGDMDLWVGKALRPHAESTLLLNLGGATFVEAPQRVASTLFPGADAATAADVDGDGDLDVVELHHRSSVVVVRNRLRQIDAAAPVRGATWTIDLFSRPGFGVGPEFAVGALGLPGTPIQVGSLGTWHVDLATLVPLPSVVVPAATGTVSWRLNVPADPTLRGLAVATQAAIVSPLRPARFTNHLRRIVE